MMFIARLIQPMAVLMFVCILICFVGYGYPGWRNRAEGGDVAWLLWLIGGIISVVAWVNLVIL